MFYIYKITNNITNDIYIGLTVRTIQERFKEHCIADSLIGNAIREYGVENFSVNTIEEIDNIDMLAEREIYWIETLKPLYNVSKGGATWSSRLRTCKT